MLLDGLNDHPSAISWLVQRYMITSSASDRPRPGAMRATTRRQDVFIRQHHLRNRKLTATSTANIVVGTRGRPIHRTTVGKRMRDYSIRCRRPAKVQVLTARHRRQRLQWAPPHRARLTTNFLNNSNIPVLPWPAMSPDCNPIEHLWDELGRRVRQRPDPPNNVQELTNPLVNVWGRIP